jgi:hypothetical protein
MRIAIVGTGISGVTLALRLQQLGIESTLFADRSPEEIADGQLLNTVARFGHTLDRERSLGIDHWAGVGHTFDSCHLAVGSPLDVAFVGRAVDGVEAVDFRVLLPRWIGDYAERGGQLVCGALPLDPRSLEHAVAGHDLVVAAVGRSSLSPLFPVDPARSPYTEPQR